jgi:hypothetical protein
MDAKWQQGACPDLLITSRGIPRLPSLTKPSTSSGVWAPLCTRSSRIAYAAVHFRGAALGTTIDPGHFACIWRPGEEAIGADIGIVVIL